MFRIYKCIGPITERTGDFERLDLYAKRLNFDK